MRGFLLPHPRGPSPSPGPSLGGSQERHRHRISGGRQITYSLSSSRGDKARFFSDAPVGEVGPATNRARRCEPDWPAQVVVFGVINPPLGSPQDRRANRTQRLTQPTLTLPWPYCELTLMSEPSIIIAQIQWVLAYSSVLPIGRAGRALNVAAGAAL